MWEAKARRGLAGELLEWVLAEGVAGIDESVRTEVFTAGDRVVVVVVGSSVPRTLPEPPAEFVERTPHAWPFTRIAGGTSR